MSDGTQKKSLAGRIVLLVAAVLAVGYFSIYWSLVTPGLMIRKGRAVPGPVYTSHRGTQKILDLIFWPAHQADRLLRPALWDASISDIPEMRSAP